MTESPPSGPDAHAGTPSAETDAGPATVDGAHRARSRRRDLAVLGTSHAGQHAYVAAIGVLVPYAIVSFHTSYAVVGGLLSACAIVGSALQSLASVARRVSTRLLLGVQNIGAVLAAGLAALAPGLALFVCARALQAITGWPQHPVGGAYLSDRHPERRASVLSWHVTAGNVGTLVAPLAMTAIVAAAGWRAAFGVLAALLVVTVLVALAFLPGRPAGRASGSARKRPPAAAASPERDTSSGENRRLLRQLLHNRTAVALLVAGTIAAGGQGIGILGLYAPAYLKGPAGLHPLALGEVLTVVYVGAVVGPVLMGALSDRLGHRGTLLANYLCGMAGLVAFATVGHDPLVLAGVGLLVGVFCYSELSLRQTYFADVVEDVSARAAFGVFFTVSQTVGGAWIAIIGVIVTDLHFFAAFATMAGTFLLAGLIVAWAGHPVPGRHAAAPSAV